MASDTVPAAVPGPGDPPSTPPANAPAPGALAGLLAPVAPVRFSLDPTDGTDGHPTSATTASGDNTVTGASSADFHNGTNNATPDAKNTASRTEQTSVVRAWLLAGAERWRKGADARLKALDIKKARATALQVKEARTTTVNRAEKMVGGSTNSGTNTNTQAKSDKNTGTKNSSRNGGTGNSGSGSGAGRGSGGGNSRNNGSGSGSGAGGRGSGSGGGSGRGNGTGSGGGRQNGSGSGGSSGSGSGNRPGQDRANKGNGKGSDTGGGRSNGTHNGSGGSSGGGAGRGGRGGRDTANAGGTGGGSGQGGRSNRAGRGNGSNTDSAQGPRSKDRGGRGTGSDVTTQTCGDSSSINPKKPAKDDRQAKPKADQKPETYKVVLDKDPASGTTPKNATKDGNPDTGKGKDTKTPPATGTGPGAPGRINTQGAREAGYRDGARVGQVIAQAGAYRDGAKDGLADTRQAAQQEKDRLDQARQTRRNGQGQPKPQLRPPVPQEQPKPGPDTKAAADPQVPGTVVPPVPTVPPRPTEPPAPSPRDFKRPAPPQTPDPATAPTQRTAPATDTKDQKGKPVPPATAQPIGVNRVGKSSIELGAGAARSTISHGEVRTLRAFQHRLKVKADGMTRVVEACAGLKSYAEQQLAKAIWWTEQARTVEGGEHLIGPLMKLEEAATIQVRKAEEIRKRAARAADSCRALMANVEIRYAPIYKAVCDSPHTKPAVLAYYREMANA